MPQAVCVCVCMCNYNAISTCLINSTNHTRTHRHAHTKETAGSHTVYRLSDNHGLDQLAPEGVKHSEPLLNVWVGHPVSHNRKCLNYTRESD